jgi:5,10-methylenetetrahydromethanopterin reductase
MIMPATEIWTTFVNRPYAEFDDVVALADRNGFDGLWVCDSQNIMPEAWVLLTRAAMLSERLKLGTFVTNPVTRHPAVTAAAAATLQEVAQGRVILGLGRGDSSLAHLGSGLMKLGPFSRYLDRLQGYLRGEAVPFDVTDTENPQCVSLASLEYAHNPEASRINWLPSAQPKVPVDVAASGSKVMALAATKAEGVTLGLGADPDAFRQAIASIHEACRAAGRDPSEVTISAVIGIAVHPDRATALDLASGSAASTSRWQLMQGAAKGRMSEQDYEALDRTRKAYDMNRHAQGNSSHAAAIAPDMIDRFAVAGPPDHCIARLRELMDLGLTRIALPYRLLGVDPEGARVSTELLVREVIPALRS